MTRGISLGIASGIGSAIGAPSNSLAQSGRRRLRMRLAEISAPGVKTVACNNPRTKSCAVGIAFGRDRSEVRSILAKCRWILHQNRHSPKPQSNRYVLGHFSLYRRPTLVVLFSRLMCHRPRMAGRVLAEGIAKWSLGRCSFTRPSGNPFYQSSDHGRNSCPSTRGTSWRACHYDWLKLMCSSSRILYPLTAI